MRGLILVRFLWQIFIWLKTMPQGIGLVGEWQVDYFLLHLILTCRVKEEQVTIISNQSDLRLSEKSSCMQISNEWSRSFSKSPIAGWENSQIRRVLARENLNYYQKLGHHQHQALYTLSLSTHNQTHLQHLLEPVSIWFVRIFHMWIEAALYLGSERNQCHRLGRYWNSHCMMTLHPFIRWCP